MTARPLEFDAAEALRHNEYKAAKALAKGIRDIIISSFPWLQQEPGLAILDFGCGTGYIALPLLDHDHCVSGTDVSKDMLDVLRNNLNGRTMDLFELSSTVLPEETFGLALVCLVMHHVDRAEQQGILDTVRKTLKKGGKVFIVEFKTTERSKNAFEWFKENEDEKEEGDQAHRRGSHYHSRGHGHEERNDNHDKRGHHGHEHHERHDVQNGVHHTCEGGDAHSEDGHNHRHAHGHDHDQDWLEQKVISHYLETSGLQLEAKQNFEITIEDHTMDCYYVLGTNP